MSVDKIDVSVVERIAPAKGPTSSSDYNATLQEVTNDLIQLSLAWNSQLQPLLDTLPSGNTNIIREERTDDPDPFVNGLDGSQIHLDGTSTALTDNGKYFSESLDRPLTVKESLENVQDQLNDAIQELQVKIAQVSISSGITSRQRQAIGARIFNPETASSPTSLDGLVNKNERNIDQVALDLSGDPNYLTNTGAMSLDYAVFAKIQAIFDAHDHNPVFNTVSHQNLQLHEHRYHQAPAGSINGINKEYFLPGTEVFAPGSLRVIVNGLEIQKTKFYTEKADNRGFDFTAAFTALENDNVGADDYLWIHYDVEV